MELRRERARIIQCHARVESQRAQKPNGIRFGDKGNADDRQRLAIAEVVTCAGWSRNETQRQKSWTSERLHFQSNDSSRNHATAIHDLQLAGERRSIANAIQREHLAQHCSTLENRQSPEGIGSVSSFICARLVVATIGGLAVPDGIVAPDLEEGALATLPRARLQNNTCDPTILGSTASADLRGVAQVSILLLDVRFVRSVVQVGRLGHEHDNAERACTAKRL